MAIDPSISLAVRPPQQLNLLQPMSEAQQYMLRAMEMRNAGLEYQQKQLQVQQQQQDYEDQQKIRNLWGASGGDLDQVVSNAMKAGVGAKSVFNLQKLVMDAKKEHAAYDKSTLENNALRNDQLHSIFSPAFAEPDPAKQEQLFNQGKQSALARGVITPEVAAMPYPGPDGMKQFENTLNTEKWLTAQAAMARGAAAAKQADIAGKKFDIEQPGMVADAAEKRRNLAINELRPLLDEKTGQLQNVAGYQNWATRYSDIKPTPPAQPIQAYIDSLVGSKVPLQDLPDWLLRKQALTMSPADWDKALTDVVPKTGDTAALYNRTSPLMQAAVKRGDYKGAQAIIKDAYDQLGRTETALRTKTAELQMTPPGATNMLVPDAQGNFKLTRVLPGQSVPAGSVTPGGLSGISGLGPADQPSPMAQMVGDYQVPLQTALSRVPLPGRQILLNQIKTYNPDFQEQYYQAFQRTENDATTGKLATSSRALNTMMGHLGTLDRAADALNNGDIQVLNRIANAWGLATGKTAKTTYDTIVHRLGPEVTKAYVAGGGSVGERGTNEEDFSSNLGANQIKQNIGISAYLADSLMKANQEQYNRGTYGRGKQKLMSDEAEQIRQGLIQRVPQSLRGPERTGGGPPAGMVAVPLKSGRTAYMPPDQAAKFRQDHPQLVK